MPPWTNILSTGLLPTPNAMWDWAISTFISQNWNTWCQCTGGSGCGQSSFNETITAPPNSVTASTTFYPIPGDPTQAVFTGSFSSDVTGTIDLQVVAETSTGGAYTTYALGHIANANPYTINTTISNLHSLLSGGVVRWRFRISNSMATGSGSAHTSFSGSIAYSGCSNPVNPYVPPAVSTPPPDIPAPPPLPTGCTTDQICGKLTYVEQELDAIARALARLGLPPHAYVEALTHAGLSGNGSFSLLATTIAYKVIMTTIPPRMGEIISSPNRYFTSCFFTAQGVEGPYRTDNLDFTTQVFQLPPLTIELNYSVPHDVVVEIIELAAAP